MVSAHEFVLKYKFVHVGGSSSKFSPPFELTPSHFLSFAEKELNLGGEEGLVNALSNVKRAIDCQMEILLYILGNLEKSRRENWNFIKKIEFLEKTGILAPRILKKINNKRNVLEHEFKIPSKEEVEDFLDVGSLFVLSTDRFTIMPPDDIEFLTEKEMEENMESSSGPYCNLNWDFKNKKFSLDFSEDGPPPETYNIRPENEEDLDFLKFYVSGTRGFL